MARFQGRSPRARRPRREKRGLRAARRGAVRRSGRARTTRGAVQRARSHLRAYRKGTILAVALTGFLLFFFEPAETGRAQVPQEEGAPAAEELPDTVSVIRQVPVEELQKPEEDTVKLRPDSLTRESAEEARETLADLWVSFLAALPKVAVALGIFLMAWILVRLLRPLLRGALGEWERADAFTALFGIAIWLVAIGVAFSVIAGDIRALLGSLGLIGLALSWALQTPIESFTGWMLNSFRGYYRVGDRISVGEVFGDVYRIDFLTTTVWEYGGPDRPPGFVRAEQPTGRLITFPNNEVLTGTVVNYTRDFPFVWDELMVGVANESDLRYALGVLQRVAREALGDYMREPARTYRSILLGSRLNVEVAEEPQVFVGMGESGAELTVRYLVGAREKRGWKSDLSLRILEELNRPEHRGKILPVYPRQQVQVVGPDGAPAQAGWTEGRPGG